MDLLINIALLIFSIFVLLLAFTFLMGIFSAGPFVPTNNKCLKKMISLVKLSDDKKIYDLGCGDGRLLRAIEKKHGIKGAGYEIAPLVYLWAKLINFFTKSKNKIHFKSLFSADLSDADVVFLYLIPFILKKLSKKLNKECKKGTLIVSEGFRIPDLSLFEHIPLSKEEKTPSFYIYKIK